MVVHIFSLLVYCNNSSFYSKSQMKNTKIKILLGGVVLLIFANFFVWQEVFGLGQGGNLEVTFFDVGQGDAIFIVSSLIPYRV